MCRVIEVNFAFIDDSAQLLDARAIAVGSRQTPVTSSRRELAVLNTYVGRLVVHTLTSFRTASTTAVGWVNGIMCAAPRTTSVAARNAGASCRAVAKGAASVFSPTRIVVGGGDSAKSASPVLSARAAIISSRIFGTSDVMTERARSPIESHTPFPLQCSTKARAAFV